MFTSKLSLLAAIAVATVLVIITLNLGKGIFAQTIVGPEVSITRPENGFATNQDEIQVLVPFNADANPNDEEASSTGNIGV